MVVRDPAGDLRLERSLVAAARIGDRGAFESLVEPHRRGVHLHCYRMMGSLTDADDMLQESLLKAWRRIDTFENRAPFRRWLYRIATHTCLNELALRRRPRFLAAQQWSGGAPPLAEIEYLQPYPDRLLGDAADPVARFDMKESVALAFIAVIQLLPPRQRAVLLLRDVLAWSAREVADSLECSIASVNSALQRARCTLRARFESGEPGTRVLSVTDVSEKRLLARFMDAWERSDFNALASLLRKDAILAMPGVAAPEPGSPHVSPTWFRGRAAIIDFLSTVPADGHLEQIRLVPVGSNLQPALAAFIAEPDDGGHRFYGVMVFDIEEGAISAITGFADPGLSDYFGPPSWLPAEQQESAAYGL
ncbi:MAG: sigma-70 family RNA polymerase sigma factor [Chloroflexi bacterium]|nr:MAG: sigma-70 family RNA polymerase sigma factor [Chloroflexota bacterium]TME24295.1 MAG: sigma-70 family RNA polymerase sigma factor [Chloroflexota bacterium]TME59153.1 MAG: sigma-70 family RNA polymerase sigma factor [Chloroflexota bacterium]